MVKAIWNSRISCFERSGAQGYLETRSVKYVKLGLRGYSNNRKMEINSPIYCSIIDQVVIVLNLF
jgi:hypothetical protein